MYVRSGALHVNMLNLRHKAQEAPTYRKCERCEPSLLRLISAPFSFAAFHFCTWLMLIGHSRRCHLVMHGGDGHRERERENHKSTSERLQVRGLCFTTRSLVIARTLPWEQLGVKATCDWHRSKAVECAKKRHEKGMLRHLHVKRHELQAAHSRETQ